MKFKFAVVALLASVTMFSSDSYGFDLLDRVLGRGGCCGCEVSSCEPDCGCEAAPVVEDCGCGEAVSRCGCRSRVGLLSKLCSRGGCGGCDTCGPTCPEPVADCGCQAPVADCGCEAPCADACDPCGRKRCGLLTGRLRGRIGGRCGCDTADDCGCEVAAEPCGCAAPAPAPVAAPCCEATPVADCGCESACDPCEKRCGLLNRLRGRLGSRCGCEAPAADCGCEAPVADCGCEAAPVVADCGCEAAPAPCADACDPCAKKSCGLLNRLRGRLGNRCGGGCAAPADDCGCEAPVADCGCEAPVADCGCDAAPSCGCGSRVGLLNRLGNVGCGCDGGLKGRVACRTRKPLRGRLGNRGCGCNDAPACGCEAAVADCGCDSGCNNGCDRLTLRDRLQGNRLPRSRGGRVLCGCPNDGCNSPCPGGCDDSYAPVSGCSSCGGGEVIYGDSYGTPVDAGSVVPATSAPVHEVAPVVNEAEGTILPGDGASAKPVVNPNAFVIRRAESRN